MITGRRTRAGIGWRVFDVCVAATIAGLCVALCGCEHRKLGEVDCVRVRSKLESAWERDALAAQRTATSEVFTQFVREEKGRLGDDWMEKCRPLVGRAVSERDLQCLDAVDTIDDVYECGL